MTSPTSAANPTEPAAGAATAKLCPCCGRLLLRASVGHGVAFQLDRCGGCGGIWFDADEWETLKSRGLHDDVHFIFSAAWQAEVARQERERLYESTLIHRLGVADYAEAKRIRAWLEDHPHRAELYGLLLNAPAVSSAGAKSWTTGRR